MPYELQSCYIKKGCDGHAILCSETETFQLIEEHNSNNIFIVKENPQQISGKASKMLNAKRIDPIESHIYNLVFNYKYESPTQYKLIKISDLLAQCGCSEKECFNILPKCYAVPYKNGIVRLDNDLLFENLLLCLSKESVRDNLVDKFITSFFFNGNDPNWREIVRFTTITYFQGKYFGDKRNWDLFQSDLKEFFENAILDINMLEGLAVVDESSSNIIYMPEFDLPRDPEVRFSILFRYKLEWTSSELIPYLKSIVKEDTDIVNLLKYHTRCVNKVYLER